MPNISITTHPTGRSPENKFFFGKQTEHLDLSRPKFNKIGQEKDFNTFFELLQKQTNYLEPMNFETVGTNFTIHSNDKRHKQFVWNMFKVTAEDQEGDWTIWHNTDIEIEPKIETIFQSTYGGNGLVVHLLGSSFWGPVSRS